MEKKAFGIEQGDQTLTSFSHSKSGQTPFLFELSGEHPTLPQAEVISCLHAECSSFELLSRGPGYLICSFDQDRLDPIVSRLALTHRVGRSLGGCLPEELDDLLKGLDLPDGSIAIRTKRFHDHHGSIDIGALTSRAAKALTSGRKVDLESPEIELRILISDMIHFYIKDREIDRKQFDLRKVGLRPFFSPISLHPRYARALVNLTRVKRGETLLDPFCGTGGILLEAHAIGIKALGSDISSEMVEGCRRNLAHFGSTGEGVEVADVGDIAARFGTVHAVATDPPYGRATTTKREPLDSLYERAFRSISEVLYPHGSLGIVLPRPCPSHLPDWELREDHKQRVHRSLSRHYCIFTRH